MSALAKFTQTELTIQIMKKLLFTPFAAFIGIASASAQIVTLADDFGTSSTNGYSPSLTVSAATGNMIVITASTNKDIAVTNWPTVSGFGVAGLGAETYLHSDTDTDNNLYDGYMWYVPVTADGTYTFDFTVGGTQVTPTSAWQAYVLNGYGTTVTLLATSNLINYDADVNTSYSLSYDWGGASIDDVAVIEVHTSRLGDNTSIGVHPDGGNSFSFGSSDSTFAKRLNAYYSTKSITSFSSGWNFGADQANLGKNELTAFGVAFVVPEPSTYALISGFVALGLILYRRRRNS